MHLSGNGSGILPQFYLADFEISRSFLITGLPGSDELATTQKEAAEALAVDIYGLLGAILEVVTNNAVSMEDIPAIIDELKRIEVYSPSLCSCLQELDTIATNISNGSTSPEIPHLVLQRIKSYALKLSGHTKAETLAEWQRPIETYQPLKLASINELLRQPDLPSGPFQIAEVDAEIGNFIGIRDKRVYREDFT